MANTATSTATIRVPIETRNQLARVAETRGISVSKLLAQIATREHLHQIYSEEREAWRKNLENPAFVAELQEWDEAGFEDFE